VVQVQRRLVSPRDATQKKNATHAVTVVLVWPSSYHCPVIGHVANAECPREAAYGQASGAPDPSAPEIDASPRKESAPTHHHLFI